jgi:hypothetical protein
VNPWIAAALAFFIGVNAGVALMCAIQINRLKHNCMEED